MEVHRKHPLVQTLIKAAYNLPHCQIPTEPTYKSRGAKSSFSLHQKLAVSKLNKAGAAKALPNRSSHEQIGSTGYAICRDLQCRVRASSPKFLQPIKIVSNPTYNHMKKYCYLIASNIYVLIRESKSRFFGFDKLQSVSWFLLEYPTRRKA